MEAGRGVSQMLAVSFSAGLVGMLHANAPSAASCRVSVSLYHSPGLLLEALAVMVLYRVWVDTVINAAVVMYRHCTLQPTARCCQLGMLRVCCRCCHSMLAGAAGVHGCLLVDAALVFCTGKHDIFPDKVAAASKQCGLCAPTMFGALCPCRMCSMARLNVDQ